MIKTNIKMRVTPEQSRKVQEICFKNGIIWTHKINKLTNLHLPYLYICDKDGIYGTLDIECYEEHKEYKAIEADLFIKTNGTCEEKYKTEYFAKYVNHTNKDIMPKDYDDALKKISNLRIALNKKVEENKNQALEITKLLEQKKDLQEINDSHVEYIKELENRLNQLSLSGANTNDTNNYIDDLCNRLKEKDTIISYLRSELK